MATGCLEWGRAQTKSGYGYFRWRGHTVYVHRLALALRLGLDWDGGWQALHRCDNPPCFDPEHLFAGSAADNLADCIAKGRRPILGEKLTEDAVRRIRELAALGDRPRRLIAEEFGITASMVDKIVWRTHWKHVT